MKTKALNQIILSGIAVLTLIGTSCQKEMENDFNPFNQKPQNQQNAQSDAVASAKEDGTSQALFADVFVQMNKAAADCEVQIASGNKSINSNEATVTVSPFDLTTWPKTVVVDFGDQNVLCSDGVYRRGKITGVITDWYRNPGCILTIYLDNYYVNNHHIEGTKTVTNNGRNANNNLTYTTEVVDAVITDPDGLQWTWSTTRLNELIAGEDTEFNPFDDEYLVTGGANGVNSNGTEYIITITEDLNYLIGCGYIRSGKTDIEIQGLPTIAVDYGDGSCDNTATATVWGYTCTFEMGYCIIM